MSLIYTNQSSKKKKNKTKKQRDLQDSFEKILAKYNTKRVEIKKTTCSTVLDYRGRESFLAIPSLDTSLCSTTKPDAKVYTGDAIIGIATLHKSNAVPVFQQQDAEDISKMRRG